MSHCEIDDDCPWLYDCTEGTCSHNPIFPLQIYPIIIYLLMPIASSLVNITGNSMGIFKVLLLMNLLRYDVADSTVFIQPIVAGTALPNFFTIMFKKHPNNKSALVDYNIVYILIPCCLLGSTLGSLIQNFIPEIVQDALVVIFFSYFAVNFWKKFRTLSKDIPSQSSILESDSTLLQDDEQQEESAQIMQKKKQIFQYEASIHLPDVLISFTVFVIFQFFVFLVQGKFSFYRIGKCTVWYGLGLAFLIALTIGYLYAVRQKLNRKFEQYRKVKYQPNIELDNTIKFVMISLGGICAGLVQGILGVGSGTFIMGVLLSFNLDTRVASATSGYQIFFIGAASFLEAFINNAISLQDAAFLFGICSILGGIATFLMYRVFQGRDGRKVNRLLVFIILILCLISVIGVFPSTIQIYLEFGWDRLLEIKFKC